MTKEWDEESWNSFSEDPNLIDLLHTDVKSGMFDIIQPNAEKIKLFEGGGKSDLEYYQMASREYFRQEAEQQAQDRYNSRMQENLNALNQEQEKLEKAKASAQKREDTKQAASKRSAATLPKGASQPPQGTLDYANASDEDYYAWYKQMQERA